MHNSVPRCLCGSTRVFQNIAAITQLFFFTHVYLRSSSTSLTSPSGLRSFSALLAQLARSVCGTTCDVDRRSFRRQLLCRIFARFAFIIIAIHISLILNIELYLLNSYLPLPHFATPDVFNAVAHSCSTLGVASVGIHLYIFVDYI